MLDYRMETFLRLCYFMNYRKTAEDLNITQPAVTQHIQHIEKNLSCKLFDYQKKRLTLTKEGYRLKLFAENVLYQEKVLLRQIKNEEESFSLRIGATKTIGEFVIGREVKNFLQDSCHEIVLEVDNTERLLEKIEKGDLDFALIEGHFNRKNFHYKLFRKEKFIGICGEKHPFSRKTLPLERVLEEHLFLREEGSGTRNIFDLYLLNKNHSLEEFKRVSTIANFGLLFELLEEGEAISFAYESVLKNNRKLSHFFVENWDIEGEYNYVYLKNPEAEKKVQAFQSYSK